MAYQYPSSSDKTKGVTLPPLPQVKSDFHPANRLFQSRQVRQAGHISAAKLYMKSGESMENRAQAVIQVLQNNDLTNRQTRQNLRRSKPHVLPLPHDRGSITVAGINRGGFSSLVSCTVESKTDKPDKLALKIAHNPYHEPATLQNAVLSLRTEILTLIQLQHRNVIELLGFMEQQPNVQIPMMVLPYCPHILSECLPATEDKQRALCTDLLSGLTYIHNKRFCHRDIKPSNCLIDEHGRLTIGDFGMACRVNSHGIYISYSQNGTLSYIPPEVQTPKKYPPLNEKNFLYSGKGDCYAAALVMGQISGLISQGDRLPAYWVQPVFSEEKTIAWYSPHSYIYTVPLLSGQFHEGLKDLCMTREQWLRSTRLPEPLIPSSGSLPSKWMALLITAGLRPDRNQRASARNMLTCFQQPPCSLPPLPPTRVSAKDSSPNHLAHTKRASAYRQKNTRPKPGT